jgi:hypothetical protein
MLQTASLAVTPACRGDNPLPCEPSPYLDGRAVSIMVAHLTSRKPLAVPRPSELEIPGGVPWRVRYHLGLQIRNIPTVPAGDYTMYGSAGGHAHRSIIWDPANKLEYQVRRRHVSRFTPMTGEIYSTGWRTSRSRAWISPVATGMGAQA